MNPMFVLVFGLIVLLYGGLNYYIGLRSWQGLFSYVPLLSNRVYWLMFWAVSLAYVLSRLGERFLPPLLNRWLSVVGAYWLGVMFYSFLAIAVIDACGLLSRGAVRLFGILAPQGAGIAWRHSFARPGPVLGLAVFLLVMGIVAYGAWNARHPVIQRYDVQVDKDAGDLAALRVAMVSDIHLGTIVHDGYLGELVQRINSLHPDVVTIVGDIIDEKIEPAIEQEITNNFAALKTRYGVYAVIGNHEYISGQVDQVIGFLAAAGVKVLRDDVALIAGGVYLVGRDDMSGARFRGAKRQDLAALLHGVDHTKPIIVLDHQPSHLEEPEAQGVDLQLSGHTHRGQLWPNQLITHSIFKDDYGWLRQGGLQIVVSSGYGTWGPPLRVGNRAEIVDLAVHFRQ